MDGDLLKLGLTALGSGGMVTVLLKVLGPALKLTAAGNEASARAIAEWERLFASQKQETAAALEAVRIAKEEADKAERRATAAERKTQRIEAELQRALERIQHLEEKLP